MRPHEIPAWQEGSLPLLDNSEMENEIERLDMTVTAVEALVKRLPMGALALGEMLASIDRGRDLVKSLLTVCRARTSLSVSEGSVMSLRSRVLRLSDRLEALARPALEAVRRLPEDKKREEPFSIWLREAPTVPSAALTAVTEGMALPLRNLHSHLLSTMKLHITTPDGRLSTMSYSQAFTVLKSADDLQLRRAVFSSFYAWIAEHGASFADLINAMLGYRLFRLDEEHVDLSHCFLTGDRVSQSGFRAMETALEAALPRIRESVSLRARQLGMSRMPVSSVLASAPGEGQIDGVTGDIRDLILFIGESMQPASVAFPHFLQEAIEKHWIDMRRQSGRAGGGWCDNLPANQAVAIFGNYQNNMAGLSNLAHTLGIGFLHRQLHTASALEKRVPLSMIETVGMVCETLVERRLARVALGTPHTTPALWHSMRRLSNMLLVLPARHRLSLDLMKARRESTLSVSKINALARNAWLHYFGETTDGCDQYLWAWKQHFYRTDVFFYDWQYVVGFLLSQPLARRFEKDGVTAAGADFGGFCRDIPNLSMDELVRRLLEADLSDPAFWMQAVDEALKPLNEARQLIRH